MGNHHQTLSDIFLLATLFGTGLNTFIGWHFSLMLPITFPNTLLRNRQEGKSSIQEESKIMDDKMDWLDKLRFDCNG